MAALGDATARAMLEEVLKLGPRGRRLLLGIAREIAAPGCGRPDHPSPEAVTP